MLSDFFAYLQSVRVVGESKDGYFVNQLLYYLLVAL